MYFDGYNPNLNQDYSIKNALIEGRTNNLSIDDSIHRTIKLFNANKIIVVLPPKELTKKINLSMKYANKGDYYKKFKNDYLVSLDKLKKLSIDDREIVFFDISNLPYKYYFDTNHLNDDGADHIYDSLKPLLD